MGVTGGGGGGKDHGRLNHLPILFFQSFALSVFQEREEKERKPKTLIPWGGEAEVELHH